MIRVASSDDQASGDGCVENDDDDRQSRQKCGNEESSMIDQKKGRNKTGQFKLTISNEDRNEVLHDDIFESQRNSSKESGGHDEQVGDRVLQSNGNKGGDGEPTSHKLSCEIVGCPR